MPEVPLELLLPNSFASVLDSQPSTSGTDGMSWTIYKDIERTPSFEISAVKSNQRSFYDDARARLHINDYISPFDVLLINEGGCIMETSISTIYVKQAGRWVTPTLASGCQAGTTRRWAIDNNYCEEQDVHVDQLVDRVCIVSNGVKGFAGGRIHGSLFSPAA